MFHLALRTDTNRHSLVVIKFKPKRFRSAGANRVCEVVCHVFVELAVTEHFVANVRLTLSVVVFATFVQCHAIPSRWTLKFTGSVTAIRVDCLVPVFAKLRYEMSKSV